ncbi:MAG: cache domain-containing protein [Lachnospiraceae bacterium]|nr:cache domain-containing protein [Lachnospiraceae bacterium]
MKKDESKRTKSKLKVRGMLMIISIVPLILSTAIICGVSVFTTKSNLEKQVEDTLYVASNILASHCSGNKISPVNEIAYYEYLDSLKEKNIDMAIVYENATCASSIRNDNDYRVKDIAFDKDFEADRAELEKGYFEPTVMINGKAYFGYFMPIITDGELVAMAFAGQVKTVVTDAISGSLMRFVLLGVAMAGAFAVVALLCSRGMVKSVNAVGKSVNALSQGDLNIQSDESSSLKEMDMLLKATELMQKNVSEVIGKVKTVSTELGESISSVTELSGSSAERAKMINNAMEELSVTAASMTENVQDINTQMFEMDREINDISEDVEHLYNTSGNILKANDAAKEDMDIIMQNSHKSVAAVNEILTQIKATNDSIEEIDKAVSLILSIADQTSLLSLNASIEAARAGEAGRGFAVVAGEIGTLSAQSAEGAEMIKNLAQTIIDKSRTSVELATGISELIVEEQESITRASSKYEELSQGISESAAKIKDIASKTDNLTNYKEIVIDNVQNLNAISEENYASNEEVSAHVREIIEEVNVVNDNCEKMNRVAQELDKSAAYFHN